MKKFAVLALALLVSVSSVLAADISGDVYTAGVTKYLWRGQLLDKGLCIQPGADLYIGKLSLSYWANYTAKDGFYNESDFTIGYSESLPVLDMITVGSGFTVYTFPMAAIEGNIAHNTEVYGTVSASVPSAPYVKFFYDTQFGNGGYLEGGVSHSIDLAPIAVSASVTGGYNFGQWFYEPSATVALATLATTYTLEKLSATLSYSYQLALDDQYENDGFASLSAKYVF